MIFDNHNLIIPDVSFYQDIDSTPQGVNFLQMKAHGAAGVIIRAGQNSWRDPDFVTNWQRARDAGLPRGAYWFFDSRAEPGNQASLWRGLIGADVPEMGLWCDFEESYGGIWSGERNWKTFLQAVKIVFPRSLIGIYTADWWWNAQAVTDPDYFSQYPLWVAGYTLKPEYVTIPYPWRNKGAVLWQYTNKGDGTLWGTESLNVDLSYFNGDRQKFEQFFGLVPSSDGESETSMTQGKVLKWTNIRADKTQFSTDYGDLLAGDIVEWIYEYSGTDGLTWLLLESATRNGAPVLCTDGKPVAGRYCWKDNVEEIVQPPSDSVSASVGVTVKATFNGKEYQGTASVDVPLQPVL